jgi:hypothetical protein
LPFLVMIETWIETRSFWILPSISASYSYQARDLFVGILFTLACFFFTYRGLDQHDDNVSDAAATFALGVALVQYQAPHGLEQFHYLFATALFGTLAYFSMVLFTKTGGTPAQMTVNKVKRNRVYTTCGWIIIGSIAVMAMYTFFGGSWSLGPVPVIFAFETVALEAFGFAWMVKGETFWRDA